MEKIKQIHPFPARMAPDVALSVLKDLPPKSIVLDPMQGSGTTLRLATEYGHSGFGFDLDPMAILLTKVWTTPIDYEELLASGEGVVKKALNSNNKNIVLDWIENDLETKKFIDFWFATPQQNDIKKLVFFIDKIENIPIRDALKVAFSKLIITKDRGASLGRDISHGKPHKVRNENDFEPIFEFGRSVKSLYKKLKNQPPKGNVIVNQGDARNLDVLDDNSIDVVITSPPYLHAVDYMRGHRLSLIWFGYKMSELRTVRSNTVGIEKKYDGDINEKILKKLIVNSGNFNEIPERRRTFAFRYAYDLFLIFKELHRVIKKNGKAIIVIADAFSSGVLVKNTQLVKNAASLCGFNLIDEKERIIPANRRYLPPPSKSKKTDLGKRMKKESVLTFVK